MQMDIHIQVCEEQRTSKKFSNQTNFEYEKRVRADAGIQQKNAESNTRHDERNIPQTSTEFTRPEHDVFRRFRYDNKHHGHVERKQAHSRK